MLLSALQHIFKMSGTWIPSVTISQQYCPVWQQYVGLVLSAPWEQDTAAGVWNSRADWWAGCVGPGLQRFWVVLHEGRRADAVLHCAAAPAAVSTDLSAKREEEKLISLRGPEGFGGISQQTIIVSQEGWEHVYTHKLALNSYILRLIF